MRRRGSVAKDKKARRRALVDQRLASLEERMTVPSATADEVTQVFQRVEKLEEGIRAEGSLATQVAHETAAQTEALATRITELAETAEALVGVDQRLASLEERMTVPSATADEVTQVVDSLTEIEDAIRAEAMSVAPTRRYSSGLARRPDPEYEQELPQAGMPDRRSQARLPIDGGYSRMAEILGWEQPDRRTQAEPQTELESQESGTELLAESEPQAELESQENEADLIAESEPQTELESQENEADLIAESERLEAETEQQVEPEPATSG